jgi:diacylglycerol kinase family enzyme
LTIHEEATLRDEKLHGLSTELKKWHHLFALIPSLILGRYRQEQDVTPFEGKKVRLETRRPMHVDIDGDIRTQTPVEISVLPKALPIFVPNPVSK